MIKRCSFPTTSSPDVYYTVDSFANGISFGAQSLLDDMDPRDHFALKLHDENDLIALRRRYPFRKGDPLAELELYLMKLSEQGVLRKSHIIFGTFTDPFHPFDSKFDASMKFIEIFRRYTPGLLTIQTRSPLIVIALPILKKLKRRVSVTIAIETPDERVCRKLTPTLPQPEERFKVAKTLKKFGVEVTLQVAPVLPYGEWKKDAESFASKLIEHSDYIFLKPLCSGNTRLNRKSERSLIAKALAAERKYHWLRPDSAKPLHDAIVASAPEKLLPPERLQFAEKQLSIFAA
ncbi:MAG: hypothetical protein D6808_07140 [Candidatus Dadabacteria bacterium]|nr:MAG: hypothetical protein D6808_07140 [Candidatus Dadabacteria bacterium]